MFGCAVPLYFYGHFTSTFTTACSNTLGEQLLLPIFIRFQAVAQQASAGLVSCAIIHTAPLPRVVIYINM